VIGTEEREGRGEVRIESPYDWEATGAACRVSRGGGAGGDGLWVSGCGGGGDFEFLFLGHEEGVKRVRRERREMRNSRVEAGDEGFVAAWATRDLSARSSLWGSTEGGRSNTQVSPTSRGE